MAEGKQLEWSMGFRNQSTGKYLTQETFGHALNANGPTLKKKQTFYLQTSQHGLHVRTHLGRYLYGTSDGKFLGDAESPAADNVWTIEPQSDGTWALKSVHGFYAHGAGDNLTCFVKDLPADGRWVVHLAMHPQVNLLNVMRKRFAHLEENELRCNEDIPWGADALLTFVFFEEHPSGRYGFRASNGQYLNSNGKLTPASNPSCQFLLGFHDDQISLRDEEGKYLSCVGANGTLKVNKDKISKDELFVLQDSEPQFVIKDTRGKWVSNRSSEEVKADQADITDLERFQLELGSDGVVYWQNSKTRYWSVGSDGSVAAKSNKRDASCAFRIEFHNTRIKLIASNGKYVTVKSNGSLVANGDGSEESTLFLATIINRPDLVLRGQFGFVGLKGASGRVEVCKSRGDVFTVESKDGAYALRAADGKYWTVDADGVAAISSSPVYFYFEFKEKSKFLIKHPESGRYLEGEQSGALKAVGTGANINTLWEY